MEWLDIKSNYENSNFESFLKKASIEDIQNYSKTHQSSQDQEKIYEFVTRFFSEQPRSKETFDNLRLKASFLLKNSKIPQNLFQQKVLRADESLKKAAIRAAVESNESWRVSFLKNLGVDFDTELEKSQTALHIACADGNVTLITELLLAGANSNVVDKNGNTPLHLYCSRRTWIDPIVIKLLIKSGAMVNRPNAIGETALHKACDLNHWQAVDRLIELGADVNANTYVESPLHLALRKSHVMIGRSLISCGADPFCLDVDNKTPLQLLYENHSETEALKLLKFYCRLSHSSPYEMALKTKHYQLALMVAKEANFPKGVLEILDLSMIQIEPPLSLALKAEEIDHQSIKFLVENGTPLGQMNSSGDTPLHQILRKKNPDSQLIELLIRNGAPLTKVNSHNKLPFQITKNPAIKEFLVQHYVPPLNKAMYSGDINEIKNLILGKERSLDKVDMYGDAPLHIAIKHDFSYGFIKALIAFGAPINQTNAFGDSALHLAVKKVPRSLEMIKLLIENGANLDQKDSRGLTPLHIAIFKDRSDLELIRFLIDKGADVNLPNSEGATGSWLMDSYEIDIDVPQKNVEYNREYSLRTSLAQFWNVKWNTVFDDMKVQIEGNRGLFGQREVLRLFKGFASHTNQEKNLSSTAKLFEESINNTRTDNIAELFSKGEPLSFQTGWHAHAISVSIQGDYLFIGNLGQKRKLSAVQVFKIDRKNSQLTKEDIKRLTMGFKVPAEEAEKYFYETLPEQLGYRSENSDPIAKFMNNACRKKSQKIGNCWWKSPMMGLFGLMVMERLESLDKQTYKNDKEKEKAFQAAFNEIQETYKQFSEYTRVAIAEEYISRPSDKAARDHQLVNQIVAKLKNKKWRHLFEEDSVGKLKPLFKKSEFFTKVQNYRTMYKLNDNFIPV